MFGALLNKYLLYTISVSSLLASNVRGMLGIPEHCGLVRFGLVSSPPPRCAQSWNIVAVACTLSRDPTAATLLQLLSGPERGESHFHPTCELLHLPSASLIGREAISDSRTARATQVAGDSEAHVALVSHYFSLSPEPVLRVAFSRFTRPDHA